MRVIGTGWRYWATSDAAVEDMYKFMDGLLDLVLLTTDPVLQLLIGGGDEHDPYQQGADRYLYLWAEANTDYHGKDKVPPPIIFHADWEKLGKAAGPLRNLSMVLAGADLMVGFVHPESKGTVDCLEKGKRAKIARLTLPWRTDRDPVDKPTLEVVSGVPRPVPVPAEFRANWAKPYSQPIPEAA